MIEAVIFDMDGVIAHTNPYHSISFKEFFARYGIYPSEEEFRDHMYGKNNGYILSHFFGREIIGEELKRLEAEKEGMFREIYSEHATSLPGLIQFLEELQEGGIKMGVATSAPRANLDLILDKLQIRDKFGSLLSEEDVESHKPSPEVYLKSAKNLKISPENSFVFEDSYSGASAGLNAGMKVIGVLTTHSKEELPDCDIYINDFTGMTIDKLVTI
ncbi:HAD family hydrolase [Algoriphagus sediminis]|uniref:HAD family phosphatase n=1 Tax=Algoriphagus sediminis TaxID=3057113 RepID=A0ABT7Y9D3_9BACT|nr:HAD family phosphatase [Algoriphagus sediminis]MDN3203127.1 HAD family phosphatase [Algoriphagus sediminis]